MVYFESPGHIPVIIGIIHDVLHYALYYNGLYQFFNLFSDALVVASPVYYGFPNAIIIACLNRLFFSTPFSKHIKVGATVVSCRRGGNTASFDVMNKYFTISGMSVTSNTYWNQVHGHNADDVKKDLEGLQTMEDPRNIAKIDLMKQ